MTFNRSTVQKIIKRYIDTGQINKLKRTVFVPKKLTNEHINRIKSWLDSDCSLSLKEIVNRCASELDVMTSISSVNKAIVGFAYSLKRIHTIPERRNCPENIELRYLYAQKFVELQGRISENNNVFIDEVGFSVSMRDKRPICSWNTCFFTSSCFTVTQYFYLLCHSSGRGPSL
ncbi:hypothetical protein CDIK_2112 [Cucumispora dikerogammari]|nr:hypothetical protein CDIK_2112 [Cucumispora dikerogammari]